MKAIRVSHFGPPEVMRLEEIADPTAGPGQVVVRLLAAGVNPVDAYVRTGGYGTPPALPYTPGLDGAGLVEAVGKGVTRLQPGQRVYLVMAPSGTYAAKTACPAEHVFALPESVSYAEGAALGVPYSTAYRALFQRAQALPGETVLIHGASGGVGLAAVQLARAAGLTVIGTAGSERGLALIRDHGVHHPLNHRDPGHTDAAIALTGGRGVDLVLEMLANVNLAADLTLLGPRGRVVVIGSRGPIAIDPRETMKRDAAILGMRLFNATTADIASIQAALAAGLEQGTLHPVVSAEMPLSEAPTAHHAVLEQSTFGKIVLVP